MGRTQKVPLGNAAQPSSSASPLLASAPPEMGHAEEQPAHAGDEDGGHDLMGRGQPPGGEQPERVRRGHQLEPEGDGPAPPEAWTAPMDGQAHECADQVGPEGDGQIQAPTLTQQPQDRCEACRRRRRRRSR